MMSMTPDQFKKVGIGVNPSPSPFLTPRPERTRPDSRGFESKSSRQDREREVNVQVILRCRPLTDDEQRVNTPKVITCNEQKREVTISQSIANKQLDRVFTFDKVFGPKSQQRSIYDQAIAPIVNEVLDGFNCTVFAYGQTGTGKTYTMEGGMRTKGGELPVEAGVIPRAVRQIFEILETQNADYSMKVTFLELYNEEITDLLVPEETSKFADDKHKKSVCLMEDGKGCVVVRGLEEEVVYSANDIYNLLERGAAKRRTADTLLNKRSSRSHSVFTITVHVKDMAIRDEELIKCGKLNLVDLAGSENISRSGAREGRAREAGEINKSLLTLGRVINALTERSPHIPYRDSKLTRLLRDSLGGKTKTCIIATISPSAHCLEETLSTLDYAYRAKNIKNQPEANQKMSKAVLLKELYLEIERMKQDVRAAREKNGVYVPHERFVQEEAEKKARNERIEQLEAELRLSDKEVDKYRELYLSEQEQKLDLAAKLKDCKTNLENTNKALRELQENYRLATLQLKEKEFIISELLHSENSLIECAKELRSNLENASDDINALHAKIDKKSRVEAKNHELVLTFGSQLDHSLKDLYRTILGSVSQQQEQLRCIEEHVCSFIASKDEATKNMESKVKRVKEMYSSGVLALRELANTLQRKASTDLEHISSSLSFQATEVEKLLESLVLEAKEVINTVQDSLVTQKELLAFSAQKQEEGLQRTILSAQTITKATIGVFDELYNHATKLSADIEESQIKNYNYLKNFEKSFKLQEQSAKEEKEAMEKIALVLATLTSKNTTFVSEALSNIHDVRVQDNNVLRHELSNMQRVSTNGKRAMDEHMEMMERHFLSDIHLVTQTKGTMEEHLNDCSQKVNYSRQQWIQAQHSMNNLNNGSVVAIKSSIGEKKSEIDSVISQQVAASLSKDVEFGAHALSLLAAINDSHMVDCETKREIESLSTRCLDQFQSIQHNHNQSISIIRNRAEQCLTKDYLVDREEALEKRVIAVPSLASIEGMRTPATGDLLGSECRSKCGQIETKTQHQLFTATASPNRAPFSDVN